MQLLDVAADIVSAVGVRALTIDAVASKAGVHRPVVYRHFTDAEALLIAVVDRELASLASCTERAVEGIVGFEPRLRAAVSAWMDEFARSSALLNTALVRSPDTSALRDQRIRQNEASMRFLVHELVADGLDATDADVLAALLLNGLVGVVRLWRARRITRPVAIDRYLTIAVGAKAALGAR